MTLPGVDPFDPIPATRRFYRFAIGPSAGTAPERPMLLVGNRTAAGSEPLDVVDITAPIKDDDDARARCGERSELYAMYRQVVAVPQDVAIYIGAATESAGAAASVELTVSGVSNKSTTWELHCHGERPTYSAEDGDDEQATAEGIADVLNGWDEGRLQMTAVAAIDGAGPDWKVTCVCAQKGPRGDQIIGADATHGIRVKVSTGAGNAQSVVKNVGSIVPGGGDDDHSAIIASIANGEWYYQVTAKHATTTVTSSDNGIGEHLTMLKQQFLPTNGKDQQLHVGLVCTQAQATAVAQSSAANTVQCRFFRQQGSDWTNAMIAAHHCAILRQQEIAYPAANVNGWTAADGQIYNLPVPYNASDHPSYGERKADLNSGVCSINVVGGTRVVLDRVVLSRSLSDTAAPDYRARESHIFSVMTFFWAIAAQRWDSIKQPNAADDPVGNDPGSPLTSTPQDVRTMLEGLIDDMAGPNPLRTYPGPLLRPDRVAEMKQSIEVTHDGRGGFPTKVNIQSVLHLIKLEAEIGEAGPSY